jgi:hypothetical protein
MFCIGMVIVSLFRYDDTIQEGTGTPPNGLLHSLIYYFFWILSGVKEICTVTFHFLEADYYYDCYC